MHWESICILLAAVENREVARGWQFPLQFVRPSIRLPFSQSVQW